MLAGNILLDFRSRQNDDEAWAQWLDEHFPGHPADSELYMQIAKNPESAQQRLQEIGFACRTEAENEILRASTVIWITGRELLARRKALPEEAWARWLEEVYKGDRAEAELCMEYAKEDKESDEAAAASSRPPALDAPVTRREQRTPRDPHGTRRDFGRGGSGSLIPLRKRNSA